MLEVSLFPLFIVADELAGAAVIAELACDSLKSDAAIRKSRV